MVAFQADLRRGFDRQDGLRRQDKQRHLVPRADVGDLELDLHVLPVHVKDIVEGDRFRRPRARHGPALDIEGKTLIRKGLPVPGHEDLPRLDLVQGEALVEILLDQAVEFHQQLLPRALLLDRVALVLLA